jgi:hypothetical protein
MRKILILLTLFVGLTHSNDEGAIYWGHLGMNYNVANVTLSHTNWDGAKGAYDGKSMSGSNFNYIDFHGLITMENKRTIQGNYPFLYARLNLGTSYGISEPGEGKNGDPLFFSSLYKLGFPWQFLALGWINAGTGIGGGFDMSPGMLEYRYANTSGMNLISFLNLSLIGEMVLIHETRLHNRGIHNFELSWMPSDGGFSLFGQYTRENISGDNKWGVGIQYSFVDGLEKLGQ